MIHLFPNIELRNLRFKYPSILNIFCELILLNNMSYTFAQSEISSSFMTPFSSNDNWLVFQALDPSHITNCPTGTIFGGPSIFGYSTAITKTFILPPHNKIAFEFKFWGLGPWTGSPYIFNVDELEAHSGNPTISPGTDICGSGQYGEIYFISKQIGHNTHQVKNFYMKIILQTKYLKFEIIYLKRINISGNFQYHGFLIYIRSETIGCSNSAIITLQSFQLSAFWGISDFKLSVFQCPNHCDSCDSNGACLNWNRVLRYFTTVQLTDGEGWKRDDTTYNTVETCGSFQYYGKFITNQEASVDLMLSSPHTKVRMQFKLFSVYISGGISLNIYGNTQWLSSQISFNIITQNAICASYFKLGTITIPEFLSNDQTLNLRIVIISFTTESTSTPYYGIRDFEVFTDAEKEIILDSSVICDDKNIEVFDGCFSQQYQCVEGCSNCYRGQCLNCDSLWIFDAISQQCLPLCGDKLIVLQEACDDGNLQPNDGCYECQFSCPLNCRICEFGQCILCNYLYKLLDNSCVLICNLEDDQKLIEFETQYESGQFCHLSNFLINLYQEHLNINVKISDYFWNQDVQCEISNYGIFAHQFKLCSYIQPQNCQLSFLDQCSICEDEFEKTLNNDCFPICNNGIVQENEFCDDSNNIQFDSCFLCQSSCQLECQECYYSFCFQCIQGWSLIDYKCVQVCGDGQIASQSQEQCDDQNNISGDGCFECKFECPQYCELCNANIECLKCQDYFEIQNQSCTPICGDGLAIEGFEICDDGNDEMYDGCYLCQYSCQEDCQNCNHKICLDNIQSQKCEIGFLYQNNQCDSICGDRIIVSNEQCDDANDIPFDGCYQCKFSCPLNCDECIQGQCMKCYFGYQIVNDNCQDVCGNGAKSENEECDDGNLISDDGCTNKCQVQINWACSQLEQETSTCLQSKPPHFNLNVVNQTYNILFINLTFTDKIKVLDNSQNLTKNLHAYLVDIDPSTYIIEKVFVVEPTYITVQEITYLFKVQILEQQNNEIYFQVDLKTVLVDDNDFQVDNDFCKIRLKNPVVITPSQKRISKKISSFNMIMLLSLGFSSLLILISGNPIECFEVLDTLQYQSNLKFINIDFPENLNIYFESSEVITILPLLEKLKFVDLFDNLIGIKQLQAFGKFLTYNINSDLITNLQPFCAQCGLGLIVLLLSKIYLNFVLQKQFLQIRVLIYKTNKQCMAQQLAFVIHKFNKISFGLLRIFSLNGFIYIVQVNSWDLIFKILLYLQSQKQDTLRYQISNFIAYFIFIIIIKLISNIFSLKNSQMELQKLKSLQHEGLILIKKLLFLYILIGYQNNSLLQCLLITFINSLYLTIVVFGDLIRNKIDLAVILVFELPIILFTLLSIFFDQAISNLLSPDNQINIAFVQMGLLMFGTMAPLIKYAVQIEIKLTSMIKRLKERKSQKKQPISPSLFY